MDSPFCLHYRTEGEKSSTETFRPPFVSANNGGVLYSSSAEGQGNLADPRLAPEFSTPPNIKATADKSGKSGKSVDKRRGQ